jgi:hypothetical protein
MLTEDIKNIKASEKALRDFGLLIGVILIALSVYSLWRGHGWLTAGIAFGSVSIVTALLWPRFLKYPHKAWMIFGALLGWVMTHVVLSLVFFVVIIPIGFIMKMFGRPPLNLTFGDTTIKSYWRKKEKANQSDIEKQF